MVVSSFDPIMVSPMPSESETAGSLPYLESRIGHLVRNRPVRDLGEAIEGVRYEINNLARMVRCLTLKLERIDGESLATQDARKLVDFDRLLPLDPVEYQEQ